jgi:hypothetical protein
MANLEETGATSAQNDPCPVVHHWLFLCMEQYFTTFGRYDVLKSMADNVLLLNALTQRMFSEEN